MKEVEVDAWDEDHIGYRVVDFDDTVYGVIDDLDENGHIKDTLVINYTTGDEILDSELWKSIIIARAKNAVTLKELLAEDTL
jgi:hypothetical protein